MFKTLQHLNSKDIVHLEIQPDNIVMTDMNAFLVEDDDVSQVSSDKDSVVSHGGAPLSVRSDRS